MRNAILNIQVTPSRMFMAGCLAFLGAVFAASVWRDWGETPITWGLAGFGTLFVFAGWPLKARFGSPSYLSVAVGIMLLGLAFGIVRTGQVFRALEEQTVTSMAGESMVLTGRVVDFPDTGLDRTRFTLQIETALLGLNPNRVQGRVRVTASRDQAPKRGDTISVMGTIRVPEAFATDMGGTFNYPMFLAKDGVTAILSTSDIQIHDDGSRTSIIGVLATVRGSVDEAAVSVLPYAEGAVLKAVLIGDEGSMTEEFKESLNRSGLRHIVAVSGMNIVIILGLIGQLASWLGWSRRRAFWFGLFGVAFFIVLIGAPASAVRASIMGLLLVAAPLLGRRGSSLRAAIAAAAVMVAISPFTLVYDVGFQLSFLAVIGIILLGPLMMRLFVKLPHIIAETLAMTFAAQIAVTPLLLTTFGRVSLVAPLSNLIVVPAIAIVTIWGFGAVFAGMFWVPIGQLIALPLLPYFSFVRWVAETFATLPIAEFVVTGWVAVGFAAMWYAAFYWIVKYTTPHTPRPIDLVPLYEGVHY